MRTLICLLLFHSVFVNAQNTKTLEYTLEWRNSRILTTEEGQKITYLYFTGASNTIFNNYLPVLTDVVAISSNENTFSININVIEEDFLTEDEAKLINKESLHFEYSINSNINIVQKEKYLQIEVIPLRKNSENKIKKLISFQIEIKPTSTKQYAGQQKQYAEQSLLANGKWYKISVSESGIYKLSYNDFQNMGISVSNPKNIRIYGYGGGQLPEIAGELNLDDMVENAIFVEGEEDGVFDASDYVLFYGQGQTLWNYNSEKEIFHHQTNVYTDRTYYFINTDIGVGKRIENSINQSTQENIVINDFLDHAYVESDLVNHAKSGRIWYGDLFNSTLNSRNYSFSFPNIKTSKSVSVRIDVSASAGKNTQFSYTIEGQNFLSSSMGTKSTYVPATSASNEYSLTASGESIDVNLTYNYPNYQAWLDFIDVNAYRSLTMTGDMMHFRNPQSLSNGTIKYEISVTNGNYTIWDVSNPLIPRNQEKNFSNNQISFKIEGQNLNEFIIFNGNQYYSAAFEGEVENQNLHGLGFHDMIIVSHPDFLEQAQRLAEHHIVNDGLRVYTTIPQKIYNEFSSGSQDIAAIRNFVKMLYDRADNPEDLPKYLLLFGDGSYDNKNRISGNTNYIPTYQSINSLNYYGTTFYFSFVTDDFYAMMDDGEASLDQKKMLIGAIDVGVGRLPVQTVQQAKEVVDKILNYAFTGNLVDPATNYENLVSNYSGWRNNITFVADDEGSYLSYSEELANEIDTLYPIYNIDKIYLDAYKQISTPGGERYPEAKAAINQRMNRGTLILNYIGHGGELGLAHERILEISDIQSWNNPYNPALFYTQTCELSRFDDPERTSAGEMIAIKANGGAIAMVTTTRPTYAHSTFRMAKVFFDNAFTFSKKEYLRIGDLYRLAKSSAANDANLIGVVLLGDPALTLAYPKYNVITTHINGIPIEAAIDTLTALSQVEVKGYIQDNNSNVASGFDGTIYPLVYDKKNNLATLGNDGSYIQTFKLQNSIIYKGKASVQDGEFSFTFNVPKDINYKYDFGKISYYAENGIIDANGYTNDLIIGGTNNEALEDSEGPKLRLFMNDTNFVDGGITNQNPVLLGLLDDFTGINSMGTGIGHDIKAVLDNNSQNPIVLNDFYEADLDSYQSGKVLYGLNNLTEGSHTLQLTVWDIYNNVSEAELNFVVRHNSNLIMDEVITYPNPFSEQLHFNIKHNQTGQDIKIELYIYNVMGRMVRQYSGLITPYGFNTTPIIWDGKSSSGAEMEDGIYIYTISFHSNDGDVATYSDKIIKIKQ